MPRLIAAVEGAPTPAHEQTMRLVAIWLAGRTGWTVRPPDLVDEGDALDRAVGLRLDLPSPGDAEVERACVEDVERLVLGMEGAVRALAQDGDTGLVVAFRLEGEWVGCVDAGGRDRSLGDGLIAPWRETLVRPSLNVQVAD